MSRTGFVGEDSGRDSAKNSPVVKEIGQVCCLLSVHLETTCKFQRSNVKVSKTMIPTEIRFKVLTTLETA